jgi:hypothetical protein
MTAPDLNSFFSGGGGRSVSWKDKPIGSRVEGVVEFVHPPQQVTDPKTQEKKFKKNGDPIMQVRIDLQTDFRNFEMCRQPDDPNEVDDGKRSLYVGGWMTGAVGDALRKAGRQGAPEQDAKLSVTLTEREPNENRALNPTNKFTAEYTPPSAAATASYFDSGNGASQQAAVEPEPQRPPTIAQAAWDAMTPETRKQVAGAMVGISDNPPF